MAKGPFPTPSELRRLIRYEPETGKLIWRKRDAKTFRGGNPEASAKRWNAHRAGREGFTYKSHRGYLVSNISGRVHTAHRVAWAMHYGEWPSGNVDHINGNRLDNRIANLRDVIRAENARNMARSSQNTSGVTGVYLHKQTGKWCAQIDAFGRTVSLGLYTKKCDAIIARKAAERVLCYHPNHGRDAVTQDALAHLLEAPHDQDQ